MPIYSVSEAAVARCITGVSHYVYAFSQGIKNFTDLWPISWVIT